jgi:ArsR family transcriptional regulator, lead/cadmium/zinc/bismuth-responsive transcriptional repressor
MAGSVGRAAAQDCDCAAAQDYDRAALHTTEAGGKRPERADLLETAVARDLAGVFKALSDPTRLRIISALADGEICVNDLAQALEMGQSAISHQLSDMRAMRLLRFRKEGRHVYYRLDDEHVRDLYAQALAHVRHGGHAGTPTRG